MPNLPYEPMFLGLKGGTGPSPPQALQILRRLDIGGGLRVTNLSEIPGGLRSHFGLFEGGAIKG